MVGHRAHMGSRCPEEGCEGIWHTWHVGVVDHFQIAPSAK